MKFSEMLGEPEPEPEIPAAEGDPISVFAPVPVAPPPVLPAPIEDAAAPPPLPPLPGPTAPPAPTGSRSGLAELNVRQEIPDVAVPESSVLDQLGGLEEIVDDLLPSARHRSRR